MKWKCVLNYIKNFYQCLIYLHIIGISYIFKIIKDKVCMYYKTQLNYAQSEYNFMYILHIDISKNCKFSFSKILINFN